MVMREHSSLSFPLNFKFLFSLKLGGMEGNELRFNEFLFFIFFKLLKYPFNLNPFYISQHLFSQPAVIYIYIYIYTYTP